jgi:hypothetical protein
MSSILSDPKVSRKTWVKVEIEFDAHDPEYGYDPQDGTEVHAADVIENFAQWGLRGVYDGLNCEVVADAEGVYSKE